MDKPSLIRRRLRCAGTTVTLAEDAVRLPDGRKFLLDQVLHPGGSAVVALNERSEVCLLRQYRHVVGEWIWELPAGKREGEEDPAVTARRETEEEAGIRAEHWLALGTLYTSPGVFTEVIHLYLARRLTPATQQLEHHELLEVHWVPMAQALVWAADGTICDAKSIVGLIRAAAALEGPVGTIPAG